MKRALTRAERETRKSAIGFFLNVGCAWLFITASGMDSWGDWLWLGWCVVCIIGCAYYVQSDIRKSLNKERD